MKSVTLCLSLILSVFTASAATYTPVAVTGYNQDLIADGSGRALSSTTVPSGFDGVGWLFVAENYSYSGTPSYYLPSSGTINSILTTNLSWQLADYTANNVLHLPNANDTGRLTFVTPQSAAEVDVLCTAGSGNASATMTVVFTDGTSQSFTGITIPDWYGSGAATNGIGRVDTADNLDGDDYDPHLYERKLTLSSSNYGKLIDHVFFENTDPGGRTNGLIGILAVSIKNVCSGKPSGTVSAPASVCPNTSFDLSASGFPDVVGLTYQWQSTPYVGGPISTISGATNSSYTSSGITQQIFYRVIVTCSVTDSSDTTAFVRVYTPHITTATPTNTTTCTSNDGIIRLDGLQNSTSYDVLYSKNGMPFTTTIVSSAAGGYILIKNLGPGIYDSIRVQYSGCTSNMVGPVTISNPTQPATPVVSNNSPICHDTTLNFTGTDATPVVTWTWSGPNSFSDTVANPTITKAVFADSGLYYAYVTDTNGCQSAIVTTRVSFMPTPDDPTGSSNAPICEGDTLKLTSSSSTSGVTYAWTGPAFPTGDTAQNPNVPNVTMSDAGDYVVYAILNGCRSINPLTLNVKVKWIPGVPTVTSNAPICSDKGYGGNNTLILTAGDTTSGVTYKWSGPNSFSASSTSKKQSITNPPMSDTGWYYVYATYKGCISATDSTHVTLKPTPAPPTLLPSLNLYCQYDTGATPLKVSGTGKINWYTVPSGGTPLPGAPTADTKVPAINVWYVTQNVNGCESVYAADTALVRAKPLPPTATGTPYIYCQGDNAKPLAVIGVKLLWYNAGDVVGSPVTPTPSTNAAGTFDYYVTQTVNGCESDKTHITVTVKPKPNKPTVSAVTYCQNDPAIPLSAGGVNLLWYNVSSGGVGIPTAPTPVTSYPDTSYYYVTQTNNGCESDRAELPVYVYYKPNAVIVASTTYVCQHDTMSFSYYGNGTSDAAYNWTMPKGASIVGGIGQGPIVARFDSAGRYNVLLQVDNHGCKSPITSAAVDVRESPIVPVVLQKEACQGDIVNVSIGNPNETIDNYNWDFGGATVVYGANGAGPYGIRFDNQGLYVVKLLAVTKACPSLPILDSIYIHPQADAHIMSVSNSTVCSGDSVHFTAESYNPSYLYQWLPAMYFENNTNVGDVYGLVQTSGYVKLSVTTEYGCTSTDSILIHAEPCCDVYFPNAFTPNGDGKNDIFRPLSNGRQEVKNFRVANRWGQIMFETVDQHAGWDGKFGGVPQDMGSYYYYIEYKCANGKTYTKKGEVVLVR